MPWAAGHRSRDRRKSKFSDWNKYKWDKNGKLIGHYYTRKGKRTLVKFTKEQLAQIMSHKEL